MGTGRARWMRVRPLSWDGASVTATLAASPTWPTLPASAAFDRARPVQRMHPTDEVRPLSGVGCIVVEFIRIRSWYPLKSYDFSYPAQRMDTDVSPLAAEPGGVSRGLVSASRSRNSFCSCESAIPNPKLPLLPHLDRLPAYWCVTLPCAPMRRWPPGAPLCRKPWGAISRTVNVILTGWVVAGTFWLSTN